MPSIFARPNKFNLSHTNVLTCEMGALVPFYTQEVLPGDEFRIKTDAMIRLAPMLAPIFGEVDLYTHYFFVPNRLVWTNWENFITNGLETGTASNIKPYFCLTTSGLVNTYAKVGGLLDYLDYPIKDAAGTNGVSVSDITNVRFDVMPVLVYNQIFNDWYRNEFVQDARGINKGDGLHSPSASFTLAYRCWPRDYMTSALPFTQLGDPVTVPIVGSTTAPVTYTPSGNDVYTGGAGSDQVDNVRIQGTATAGEGYLQNQDTSAHINIKKFGGTFTADVDISDVNMVTINDLRTAFQLQRSMERKARSGNRYVEYLAASFGVRSPDARLQRAEFLGGGKSPVMISEVLQTSAGTQNSPQGNMSGHGFGASRSFSVNKAFTEHGYIMGILSVMPKASYYQGRKKELCRWTWTDYYQPEFAHLGEQAVYKSELLANSTVAGSDTFDNGDVFGYQPRYEEYRRKLSGVHGDFRTSMNYWHLARTFSSAPALNSDFVTCKPSKRIFAAGDQADRPCWIEMVLNIKAIRPLPKKGTPGLIDH